MVIGRKTAISYGNLILRLLSSDFIKFSPDLISRFILIYK
ncbi:hypothetical protein LEP1GSC175_3407 [Leptospira santarosai str. HAI821]|nr:hypothetical protein LEP1GSC175_3407 [Leptospira santarosai str. HAI821]